MTPKQQLETLLNQICKIAWVTPEDVRSGGKHRRFAYVRHAFCIIAPEEFPFADPEMITEMVGVKKGSMTYYLNENEIIEKKNYVEKIKKALGAMSGGLTGVLIAKNI